MGHGDLAGGNSTELPAERKHIANKITITGANFLLSHIFPVQIIGNIEPAGIHVQMQRFVPDIKAFAQDIVAAFADHVLRDAPFDHISIRRKAVHRDRLGIAEKPNGLSVLFQTVDEVGVVTIGQAAPDVFAFAVVAPARKVIFKVPAIDVEVVPVGKTVIADCADIEIAHQFGKIAAQQLLIRSGPREYMPHQAIIMPPASAIRRNSRHFRENVLTHA